MEAKQVAVGALIAGLCLAGATAIAALVDGEFDDTHGRVVATSLGFGVFSALGASGEALRRRPEAWSVVLGGITTAAAAVAFASGTLAVWMDYGDDALWRVFGVSALLAVVGSHASLVLRSRRREDPPLVSALVATSIVCATFDMLLADTAILELVDDVDEAVVRFAAVVLVVMLLSTALPPLLRRAARPQADALGRPESRLTMTTVIDEIAAAATRLDAAASPDDVRREAAFLRELADRARR